MEAIGDSTLVNDERRRNLEENSIEFERNLDEIKITLECEEIRLMTLQEKREKVQKEIDDMYREILEEKKLYRDIIDSIISEGERFHKTDSRVLQPIESCADLLDACYVEIEGASKILEEYNIELDIEKIRCELINSYVTSDEHFLATMKDHLVEKKVELQSSDEVQGESEAALKSEE